MGSEFEPLRSRRFEIEEEDPILIEQFYNDKLYLFDRRSRTVKWNYGDPAADNSNLDPAQPYYPLDQIQGTLDTRLVEALAETYQFRYEIKGKGKVSSATDNLWFQKAAPNDGLYTHELVYHREIKIQPEDGSEIYVTVRGHKGMDMLLWNQDWYKADPLTLLSYPFFGKFSSLDITIAGTYRNGKRFYSNSRNNNQNDHLSLLEQIGNLPEEMQELAMPRVIDGEYIDIATKLVAKWEDGIEALIDDENALKFALGHAGNSFIHPGVMARDGFRVKVKPTPRREGLYDLDFKYTLPFGTEVLISREYNDWYYIQTKDGKNGWVEAYSVALRPAGVDVELYRVKDGDTLDGLVTKEYNLKEDDDKRTYIAAIVVVNRLAGRAAGIKPTEEISWFRKSNAYYYENPHLIKGHAIWVPSLATVRDLEEKGVISNGSITEAVLDALLAVGEFIWDVVQVVVGFIGGVIYGVVEAILDIFIGIYDLAGMFIDFFKALISGELYAAIKEIYDEISKMTWEEIKTFLGDLVDELVGAGEQAFNQFLEDWDNKWLIEKAFFVGRVVGYIVAEILLAIFTGGGSLIAKWLSKLGAKFLKWGMKGFQKLLELIRKLAKRKKLDPGEADDTIRKHLDELEGDKKKGDGDGKDKDKDDSDKDKDKDDSDKDDKDKDDSDKDDSDKDKDKDESDKDDTDKDKDDADKDKDDSDKDDSDKDDSDKDRNGDEEIKDEGDALDDDLIEKSERDKLNDSKEVDITKGGLKALLNDLKNLPNMTRADIARVIKEKMPSLQYKGGSPDGRFMQWKDSHGRTRIRIDPPDPETPFDHIHLYDSKGNSLDIDLNVKPMNSPDVHIPIKAG